ncbi:MAG: VOC family protein [Curvibacter lanceolatus]|jgi:catechol 2,3-dioxygenase-like lactoylglutathione lyase family enzyme|uniref:VOC family protein n=1 Tax=Curvibacter lanceolatus TaxID=86182 RepID=UPI00036C0734|nr:VOC family protein [Curvibacter lanceolatus]MBV5290925.1 VOC family protein [Curvibacter lanceolatus]
MPLPLDHIVIAVHQLDRAIADYRALGFQVLIGGRHNGRTSHNALVVFQDGSYLELIAWEGPAPQERWYNTLQSASEGLVDFALLPGDTTEVLNAARARGLLSLEGPFDGARLRPDGAQLRWQTARHASPDLPFLCGDISPRALRVSESPADRLHPNGCLGVARLDVAVQDLSTSLARYQALLGPDLPAGPVVVQEGMQEVKLTLGSTELRLLSPAPEQAGGAEAQALKHRLATRGEGPCALVLRGGPTASPGKGSDQGADALSHGVAWSWASHDAQP